MSFLCAVTNEIVKGKTKVLVPILKRKVRYQKYVLRKDNKTNETFKTFVGDCTEGWEIVKEVSTTIEHENQLLTSYENNFLPETKTIYFQISNKEYLIQKEKEESEKEKNQENNAFTSLSISLNS